MNDIDLAKLIKDVGTFQAQYQPTPLAPLPAGCVLPGLLPGDLNLPPVDLPEIPKTCSPLFIPYPLIPEPFTPPETCPNGITFTPSTVNIYNSISAKTPAGTIQVSAAQDIDNLCNYVMDIPDVVIPCFPTGPQMSGAAHITVIDSAGHIQSTSNIQMVQDSAVACRWILEGDTTIVLPGVPCPTGISFSVGTPLTIVKADSTSETLGGSFRTTDSCNFTLDLPPIDIPCYPAGPQFVFNTTPDGGTTLDPITPVTAESGCLTTINIPIPPSLCPNPTITITAGTGGTSGHAIPYTACNFPVQIPCYPTGPTFTTSSVPSGWTPQTTPLTGCSIDIPIPAPICTGGFTFINASTISVSNPASPLEKSVQVQCGGAVYTVTYPSAAANGDSITFTISGGAPGSTFRWLEFGVPGVTTGGTFTVTQNRFGIGVEVEITNPTPEFFISPCSYSFYVPVVQATVNSTDGLQFISLDQYANQFGVSVPANACGMALVGNLNLGLPCPSGYSVGTGAAIVGTSDTSTISIALQHVSGDCGFEIAPVTIPALLCPDGYVNSTVAMTVVNGSGRTGTFTGTVGNATGNADGQYCGFAITGTLTLPASSGGGYDYDAYHYQGEYNATGYYLKNDVVRVSPTNPVAGGTVPGVYICVGTNTISPSTPADARASQPASFGINPKSPIQNSDGSNAENGNWQWLATWPTRCTACSSTGTDITVASDQQPIP